MYLLNARATLTRVNAADNSALEGGFLYALQDSTVTASAIKMTTNRVTSTDARSSRGGSFFLDTSSLNCTNCVFTSNSATSSIALSVPVSTIVSTCTGGAAIFCVSAQSNHVVQLQSC